jgi:hypothetical protein
MKYFIPKFQIATISGKQTELKSKIGGVPWGLPPDRWPSCCGHPQKLLAQFLHEPPILDLGAEGAVLHLFQCLECCGIDEGEGKAAFILQEPDLGQGLVTVPGYDSVLDLGGPLIGEFWMDGWAEADDNIPESRFSEFFDESSLWALHDEFPNIDWFASKERTKFGGSPRWTANGPMGAPPKSFEFLCQIDCMLSFEGQPPTADEIGCNVTSYAGCDLQWKMADQITTLPKKGLVRPNAPWGLLYDSTCNKYSAEFTNLGSDGTLYVFINRTTQPHEVMWFWNR